MERTKTVNNNGIGVLGLLGVVFVTMLKWIVIIILIFVAVNLDEKIEALEARVCHLELQLEQQDFDLTRVCDEWTK